MPKRILKPKLDGRRTHFRIERTLKGIGEIRVSSGTDSSVKLRKMLVMLEELHANPHWWHWLRDLKGKKISMPELYHSYLSPDFANADSMSSTLPLASHMFTWLDESKLGEDAKENYRGQLTYLLREKGGKTVRDLPDLLKAYQARCKARGTYASFDLCRSAVMSYLTHAFDDQGGTYAKIQHISRFGKTFRKRPGKHLSVKQILELMTALSPKYRDVVWSMFTSGFRTKEYQGAWSVVNDCVHIAGTKTEGSVRRVPMAYAPVRHRIHTRSFAQIMKRATDGEYQPYDLRRSYARLLVSDGVGIPLWRAIEYMGHGDGLRELFGSALDDYAMTLHYQKGQIPLEEIHKDATRIREFVEEQRTEYVPPSKKHFQLESMNERLEIRRRAQNAT